MPPRSSPTKKWARSEGRKIEKAAQTLGLQIVPVQLDKLLLLSEVDRDDVEISGPSVELSAASPARPVRRLDLA